MERSTNEIQKQRNQKNTRNKIKDTGTPNPEPFYFAEKFQKQASSLKM